jgi:hypothetical protein
VSWLTNKRASMFIQFGDCSRFDFYIYIYTIHLRVLGMFIRIPGIGIVFSVCFSFSVFDTALR